MSETVYRVSVRSLAVERARLQFVELEPGLRVGLLTRWSAYESRWTLCVYALDGVQIFGPRLLVPGLDLLLGAKHDPRVPGGQLFVYSVDREPPDLDTVDTSALLLYRRIAA